MPVDAYIAGLDAGTAAMVTQLRRLALAAAPDTNERIKWKAPSFGPGDEDRITLGLDPKGGVRVILHRGATAKTDPAFRFADPAGLIRWAAPDRGVLSFKTLRRTSTNTTPKSPISSLAGSPRPPEDPPMTSHLTGFGNHFSSEAIPGALPIGRNSPQKPAFGLYAEQLSGTAFTMARAENRRSWLYRLRPSAEHPRYVLTQDFAGNRTQPASPNRLRWSPREIPAEPISFHDSVMPALWNGDPESLSGVTVSTYACTESARQPGVFLRRWRDADHPRTRRPYAVHRDGPARYRTAGDRPHPARRPLSRRTDRPRRPRLSLREPRRPVPPARPWPHRLQRPRQPPRFRSPTRPGSRTATNPSKLIQKFGGKLWTTHLDHSPLDVVAWHGNLAPMKYDLRRFNTLGTVSFDHPDPSIFTVLTSPSDTPGRANADFVIFPPRWMVAEDTFRPPWFHRNLMSEAMGLITGAYDAKADGFAPGALSLHNMMSAHGPDVASWQAATEATLAPHKIDGTMAFMIESCLPYRVTDWAMASAQPIMTSVWNGFPKAQLPRLTPQGRRLCVST